MSFDDDAEIPMDELVSQWDTSYQQVASLIGGGKRMSPGGELLASFVKRGYLVDTHPMWFGKTWRENVEAGKVVDAPIGEGGVPVGELVDLGEVRGGVDVDEVFTPKSAVPIGQGSQVVHQLAQQATQQPQQRSATPASVAANSTTGGTISASDTAESSSAERHHLRGGERYLGEDGASGRWRARHPWFIGSYLRSLSSLDSRRAPKIIY